MTCEHPSFTRHARFQDLAAAVQHCDLCPRLCGRTKILTSRNGNLDSQVLVVAEAPGRLGADRTGVPLHGDKTGDNFETLLANVGWRREDLFITNAVLCNPQDSEGCNASPTRDEIANCSIYLDMVIALIRPKVIITLGAAALAALDLLAPHGKALNGSVAKLIPWRDVTLVPLYHPGPRALFHRSLAKQRADFMLIAKVVHPIKGLLSRERRHLQQAAMLQNGSVALTPLQQSALALLQLGGRMTYFKLAKLLYLTDLAGIRQLGHMIAATVYLRQVDGPWPPALDHELERMNGREIRRSFSRRVPVVEIGPAPRAQIELPDEHLAILAEVYNRYEGMSNAQIKAVAYSTSPMRHMLRLEQYGQDMRNKAILYSNKTAEELHPQ